MHVFHFKLENNIFKIEIIFQNITVFLTKYCI